MIVDMCTQLSPEWFSARVGKPTASHFNEVVTTKGAISDSVDKYMKTLAGEFIAGEKSDTYQSFAMQRGTALEPDARNLFGLLYRVEVREVGLCYPNEQKMYSCSPDGLMEDAGLEIKSPLIHTHVGYLLKGKFPTQYTQQVQGSMLVTGFSSWWFMSYYPGLPPLILKVERDNAFCDKLEKALEKFCFDLATTIRKLKELT